MRPAVLSYLCLLLALASMCCTRVVMVTSDGVGRNADEERKAAVTVHVWCKDARYRTASGVLIGPRRIVTAYHAVSCDIVIALAIVPDQASQLLSLALAVPPDDLAIMTPRHAFEAAPVTIAPVPPIGALVCSVPAHPKAVFACGPVIEVGKELRFAAPTIPGNSGAGVYDSRGRLVGITTATINGIAGVATPLHGKRWRL